MALPNYFLDKWINEFKILGQELVDKDIATPSLLVGCTQKEIESLECNFDIYLPLSYKAYLLVMGMYAGDLWCADDAYFDELTVINQIFKKNLVKNGVYNQDYFAFHMHDGYEFLFFDLSKSLRDPKIYFYVENLFLQVAMNLPSPFEEMKKTFFEFIESRIY